MDKGKRQKIRVIVTVVGVGLVAGVVAVWHMSSYSPAWGNFIGAITVACGGLLGCLGHSDVASERLRPA